MQGSTCLPVLLVAFKRPETTRLVIDAIRRVRPPRVYFAVDGPRPGNAKEAAKVAEVRDLLSGCVDWDCEVKILFREENLGCARGVSEAIDFFFEHEEAGMILEDDCVPEPDFFEYCEDLLVRYRDDARMMHISGSSRVRIDDRTSSYFLSRYPQIWGWATWREAWSHFSFDPPDLDRDLEQVLSRFATGRERRYWEKVLRRTFKGKIDSWAYRWAFALWRADGISAYPTGNLVRNVGFGSDSTHTGAWSRSRWSMPGTEPLGELRHPSPAVVRDDLDSQVFDRAYARPGLPVQAYGVARNLFRHRATRPGNGLVRVLDRMPAPIAGRFRSDSRLARLVRPALNRLAPQGETVVTIRSGPGEGLRVPVKLKSEKYYWTGAHEPHVQAALEELLKPGMTFWDVGAHIGFVTVMAARMVGDEGRVVSFEPMPETARRLRRSVALNDFGNVTVIECAVDDFDGEKTLHPPRAAGEGDADSAQPTVMWTLVDEIGAEGGVSVRCRRLDDLAEELGTPDLIKIDAEGAEADVLASGATMLERGGTRVIIEISDDEILAKVRAQLPEADFRLLGANHWLIG